MLKLPLGKGRKMSSGGRVPSSQSNQSSGWTTPTCLLTIPDHYAMAFADADKRVVILNIHPLNLLTTETAYSPFPFVVGRERQFDIAHALLNEIEADRSNAPPRSLAAANAPEPFSRSREGLIPSLAFETPPKAVRIEDGAMAAFADRLDRFSPSRGFENIGRNA